MLVSWVGTEFSGHVNKSTMSCIDFTLQRAGIGTIFEDQFLLNGLTRQDLRFATVAQSKIFKETADLVGEFFKENARNFANNKPCPMILWLQHDV